VLAALLLLLSCAHALKYAEVVISINHDMSFDANVTIKGGGQLTLVFLDAREIRNTTNCASNGNVVTCKPVQSSISGVLKNTSLSVSVGSGEEIEDLLVVVKLPSTAVGESAAPKDYVSTSDGKRIIFVWEARNVSANDMKVFSVRYSTPSIIVSSKGISTEAVFLIILLLLSVPAAAYYFFRRKKMKVKIEVLRGDEKKVMEIVYKHKEIDQKEIVRITDFSKAKVSKIVMSLEKRGLIEVERRGRKNIIRVRF